MPVVLRQARREHIAGIQRVRHAVRENRLISGVVSDEDVREAIEDTGRGWVVLDAGEVVAFAVGNARTGNIWALFVDPAHERKGHGRRLLEVMVQWLWQQGVPRLWLSTDGQTRAEQVYRAAGWQCTGPAEWGETGFELHRPATLASAALLSEVQALALAAGELVLEVYASPFAVEHKNDRSPVTLADTRAEHLITPVLAALLPGVPVVAEEAASIGQAPVVGQRFWLVDPLDGTREFVKRNGEFTVNIALVEHGQPVLGVVWAPALRRLFCGLPGQGAWGEDAGPASRRPLRCRVPAREGLVVAGSRSHGAGEALLARERPGAAVAGRIAVGSSLKFGLLAAAEADVYPRPGRTMEWDTAAGHAVLRAAGGEVYTEGGALLRYGKPGFENPSFVAWGQT